MISLAYSLDKFGLALFQVEVSLAAIGSLTTLTTQRYDSYIRTVDGSIEFIGSKLLLIGTCRWHE